MIARGTSIIVLTITFMLNGGLLVLGQEASVLATGAWLRLAVTDDGLYRVTPQQLRDGGWNPDDIDPTKLQLYGYGGGMLPQSLDTFRYSSLPENAVWVTGTDDGRFDDEDYLVFYGQSADRQRYHLLDDRHVPDYQKNLYADTTYYFLTVGETPGKRVATAPAAAEAGFSVNYYDDYAVYEHDETNLRKPDAGSGREWYGESFTTGTSRSFALGLSDRTAAQDVSVTVEVLGTSTAATSFAVGLNGKELGTMAVGPIEDATYVAKGSEARAVFTTAANAISSDALTVSLRYPGSGTAYLNRIVVEATRVLRYARSPLRFRTRASTQHDRTTFVLSSSASDLLIWDVTDPQVPVNQEGSHSGSEWKFSATTAGELREFIAVAASDLAEPQLVGPVATQNIQDGSVPNLVIVSPLAFRVEAERLAELRRQHDRLTVRVVTPQQIYNEFSSGRQDVSAIRNYMKYLYDTDSAQLRYLLLFGKCSYDYKGYLPNNTNFVPTYESRNSLHPIYSYSSDDYYAFLEDEEGAWEESRAGDHTMDIGVGRLPVKSTQEARVVVDKLIHYATDAATRGRWRNEVVFVADDGDNNKHQRDAEQLTQALDTAFADYSLTKIYLDAFPQESLPGGEQSEAANRRIEQALKQGALIVNYTGHGSETRWTQENIFNLNTINQLRNYDRLPFFVTATCEFGRYDDPTVVSGAEQLILSERGGAIGLVTTARPVFSNSNFLLNKAFYQRVFASGQGEYPAIGEVFRRTKNDALNGPVNRNFSLLGDPSMKLAYPQDQIVIEQTEVLRRDGTYEPRDTLAALDRVRLSGKIIRKSDQETNAEFNGTVTVEVLDKTTVTETRGSDGAAMQFTERNSVIHRGRARVRQGQFTLNFVMPKNIVYRVGPGKLTSYAQSGRSDAHGADRSVVIGGSSSLPSEDTTPPQVQLFLDDTTFVSGGLTGDSPTLLAHLSDAHGISITTTSLGQDLTATLVHQESGREQQWPLDEFYETDTDTFQSGTITYPMNDLATGHYTLTLRVGDTYNNVTEAQTRFVVSDQQQLEITHFYNYPNPFSGATTFVVDHNRPGDDLSVHLRVLDNQGRRVAQWRQKFPNSTSRLRIPWEEARMRPGVYVTHIMVQSLADQLVGEKFHKLIISP